MLSDAYTKLSAAGIWMEKYGDWVGKSNVGTPIDRGRYLLGENKNFSGFI